MTTLGDNFKDRSTDNKLKKIQDTLEKSSKLKKAENNPMILEAGRKPSNATKQPIGKKDNLKKLTIAIANYYDSTKIVEKSGHILSSKFEETKNRNLFPAKYHSVLLGSKAESTFHSSKPGQNKTEASSGDCKVEKAKHLETQNRLVSNPHTRGLKQEREPKAESYRYFTTNEQITPSLLREKTVPKMPTMSNQEIVKHSQFHMNHITLPHNHQKNQRESASMFKACINSISQKNEGTSKHEHKKGDKPRLYLNSISSYSGKVAESNLTSKSNMKTPKLEVSIFNVKQSSHDQNTGNNRIKNKENRNSKAVNIQNISQEPKANYSKQLNPDRGDPNSSLQQPRNYHIFTKATINHKNINLSSEDYEHNPVKKEKTISTLSLKNTIAAGALKKVKRAINRSELDIIQQKLKNSIHNKESSYITLDNHEDQVLIDKSSSGSSRSLRCGEMMNIDIPVLSHLSADETSLKEDEGLRTEEYHPEPTNLLSDPEILKNMILSENEYQFNPHYLSRSTTGIKWNMRAILVDWMIEVADDFGFKRSTFYLAVCNVDRYLAAAPQTNTKHLQLIGLTCLMIATKLEEIYSLTLPDWSSITLKSFTEEDIQQAELSILKTLGWRINPPTFFVWVNWYTSHWDSFVETHPFARNHKLVRLRTSEQVTFRKMTSVSYNRLLVQLIDCSILDVETLQYKMRPLVAAFMYIIVGKEFEQFSQETVVHDFPTCSIYMLGQEYAFNSLFGKFMEVFFGMALEELLPFIQYAATFISLEPNFNFPSIADDNRNETLSGSFEDFLAYQTHHPSSLNFILQKRPSKTNY